jgi:hypothetical protein
LTTFNTGTGALRWSAQNLDQSYYLDDRGVIAMGTALNFGNFLSASITANLRPFVTARRELVTASIVQRDLGQYRLFFSDSTALFVTISNGEVLGSMPIQYDNSVTCAFEGASPDGQSLSYFGSTNGFVYSMDAGTSFDGNPIAANLNLIYSTAGSPRILKRYRKASMELTGGSYAEVTFGYDLGYRTPTIEQPFDAQYSADLRSAYWDNFIWDNFIWDGADIAPSEIELVGTAENLAVRISCVSDLFETFTINSIIVHYTPRRGIR